MVKPLAMEKPLLELSPSIINALFPLFVRNLFFSSVIVLSCSGLLFLLRLLGLVSVIFSLPMLLGLVLLGAFLPLSVRLFILMNTTYRFFRTHVVREFRFLVIRSYTVSYSHVANISLRISLWDRLCRAGDVVLHTAEDDTPDLTLHYIVQPEAIEQRIYELAHAHAAASAVPLSAPSSRRGR